jgi:coenzyme F420-reducing hydrogenase gamma subunit
MECKRKGLVCTLVAKGESCMGPVTLAGCGALCPSVGRGCYGCYGPASQVNGQALAARFTQLGLEQEAVLRQFRFITGNAPEFKQASERLQAAEGE